MTPLEQLSGDDLAAMRVVDAGEALAIARIAVIDEDHQRSITTNGGITNKAAWLPQFFRAADARSTRVSAQSP